MHLLKWTLTLAAVLSAACSSRPAATSESLSLTPAQAARVQADVRAFAQVVAHDVTQDGPEACPSFFMAAEGNMAFPNSEAATTGLQEVARRIKHIELKWGHELRIDPLTPDLAIFATPWHEVQVEAAGR